MFKKRRPVLSLAHCVEHIEARIAYEGIRKQILVAFWEHVRLPPKSDSDLYTFNSFESASEFLRWIDKKLHYPSLDKGKAP